MKTCFPTKNSRELNQVREIIWVVLFFAGFVDAVLFFAGFVGIGHSMLFLADSSKKTIRRGLNKFLQL